MPSSSDKIALFIDGANLHATSRALGFDIDYKHLLKEFQSRGTLLRAFYYTAIIEDQEFSSIRPLIDWLDYNGYTVVTKATKEFIDASGRRKVKGNMDIELAVDAMELAEHIDQMVLFSGDGNFRSLVEAMQRRGVHVTVVSTISSQPPMIADELRRQADVFTDLAELQSKIARDPSERPARANRAITRCNSCIVRPQRRRRMTTISTNNRGQCCRRAALFRPLFGGPHDDNGPLRQQQCALGSRLTEIALHCFYRRLVIGHPDRPTDHVYPTSLEGISIIGVMPKF
jgi:uncharacterized LabA/DUF88 family protein